MSDSMDRKVLTGVMILVGGAIGAGFLAIPYGIAKCGLLLGLIQLLLVGLVSGFMSLYVAELVSRVKGRHQVVGLVGKFLGKKGKIFITLAMFIGIYGALTAYGIGISTMLSELLGIDYTLVTIALFSVAGFIIHKGIRAVDKSEVISMFFLIPTLIFLSIVALSEFKLPNIMTINIKNFFYPFGIILFACLAYQSVPEISKVVEKKKLRKVILLGTFLFVALYSLFAFSFVGAYGQGVEELAVESLSGIWRIVGILVGTLAMATTFLILGLVIRDTYIEDYNLKPTYSFLLTILPPFFITLLRLNFATVVGLTGAITGGLVGIILGYTVYVARKKQKTKPEFMVPGGTATIIITTIVFLLGMTFEVMKYI